MLLLLIDAIRKNNNLDDIIIPSKDVIEGLYRLKEVLKSLDNADLTIRLDKCKFFMGRIDYLGFEISAYDVESGQQKIMVVEHSTVLENVRVVRREDDKMHPVRYYSLETSRKS